MFKALTWTWLSKVNGPTLPKERCIKEYRDGEAPPEKNGAEKTSLTIEAHPHHLHVLNTFIEAPEYDTKRYCI